MYIDTRVLNQLHHGVQYVASAYPVRHTAVVLGRSTSVEEIHIERCREDGVPVLRRAGGGGAVVLCRGMVVISAAGRTTLPFLLREHMNLVNQRIMAALYLLGVGNLSVQGISDIALEDRKVLGSSLYRTGDTVLYQGSLLVSPDLGLIDRYLKHPFKEPAYRRHRPHVLFLTTLHARGHCLSAERVSAVIQENLEGCNPWERKHFGMQHARVGLRESASPDEPSPRFEGETHAQA